MGPRILGIRQPVSLGLNGFKMNIKTLVLFLLVTAVVLFGVTRIPRFSDPFRRQSSETVESETVVSNTENDPQRRSLLRKGDGKGGRVGKKGRTDSKKELEIKLKAKEQRQLARLTTVLESDTEAAYFFEKSEQFRMKAEEIASSGEMSEIEKFLRAGSTEEQTHHSETYQEILKLIRIPEIVLISADPKLEDTIEIAFMNGVLPIPDDVTTWLENVDELVGYKEGINTNAFNNSLEWMIANLQERGPLVRTYIDGVLGKYGFPDSTKETLHAQVRAEMMSRLMSANLLHRDQELLQLANEIQSLRNRLAVAE